MNKTHKRKKGYKDTATTVTSNKLHKILEYLAETPDIHSDYLSKVR